MSKAKLIAIDWGSTHCRAYLLSEEAQIIAQQEQPTGILHIQPQEFESVYSTLIGSWTSPTHPIPVIMSGMVGSQLGWVETPYLSLPTSLKKLAQSLVPVTLNHTVGTTPYIVPGLVLDTDQDCDVLRGEETQMMGALALAADSSAKHLFCLPGTHSKWGLLENQQITFFRSYMTGELFSLLSQKSILAKTMTPHDDYNADAFAQGFKASYNHAGLLADLFTIRARSLRNYLNRADAFDYLSGLLIGHEIQDAQRDWPQESSLTLIASASVAQRYQYAFALSGKKTHKILSAQATTQGLWQIAKTAQLI